MNPTTNGVHISDSLYSLAWEQIAPDYLDRYQPTHCRPVGDVDDELDATQELQAVAS